MTELSDCISASIAAPRAVVSRTTGRPNRQIDDVGQKLHQPIIFRHAAIDAHHRNRDSVTGDGGEQIVGLVGNGLQRRADEIGWAGVTRDPVDGAACMRRPMRRPKAGEAGTI